MAEKGKRGFAGMDAEKQRQIASKGGKAAHQKGRAHEFTSEEAREAGRKARHGQQRTAVSPAAQETGRAAGGPEPGGQAAERPPERPPEAQMQRPPEAPLQLPTAPPSPPAEAEHRSIPA